MKRRLFAVVVLVVGACMGVSWAAYRTSDPEPPKLSRYVPCGALLYLQAKDLSVLLADWNGSGEKQLWLKSSNYEAFSRSRLFLRLADANTEFARAAGIPTDNNFLKQVAGTESALAIFDIGTLAFLYITRLPSASSAQSALWQTRGKFETRSAGGVTFYLRRDAESAREVAFAVSGEYLLLGTRADLLAGALQLMAGGAQSTTSDAGTSVSGSPATDPATDKSGDATKQAAVKSIETETWWSQAVAAAGAEGDLRMVLNLDKIVPSPYFRSYWIQKNIAEMKRYSSAISDLVRNGNEYREERVLLRKVVAAGEGNAAVKATILPSGAASTLLLASAPETAATASLGPAVVADIARLVPAEAGVFVARANPTAADCLALLEQKILAPHYGPAPTAKLAPQVALGGGETGSNSDLETRIDVAPVAAVELSDSGTALKSLLAKNAVSAGLQVSSTEQDAGGVFVRVHSAVALVGQADWDDAAVLAALAEFVAPSLTTGNLGVAWQKNSDHLELNGLWTLNLAVRGKYLLLSDDASLLQTMLERTTASTTQKPAEYLAGFDHTRERHQFAKLTGLLDRRAAEPGPGNAPTFFSGNIGSLSAALAGVSSERVEVHDAGDRVRQTVTYRFAGQ